MVGRTTVVKMTVGCGRKMEKHWCTQQYAKNVGKKINMDPTDINE